MARILFVNDDADLAYVCKVLLESRGHFVEAVEGGGQALAKVDAFAPDLVIVDSELGDGMAGSELVMRLRRRHRLAAPIVMITARRDAAIGTGVDAVILKPFISDELLVAIDRLLYGARAHPH